MTTFKKAQAVYLIANWNGKGQFYITPAIVYSCGKKQMVLTSEATGHELGRSYKPSREQFNFSVVIDRSENAEAQAIAQAEAFLANEISRLEGIMGSPVFSSYAEGYKASIAEKLAMTRTFAPSFIYR